ncbi:MAG: transposase [Chloroflexales bacterium]|nr:transposase [Chloroflexales bacterium]
MTADRGVHSAANERDARAAGVRQVVLPKPGKLSAKRTAYELQDWFRAGRNWRAGIEGRISSLKRNHGLRRCRYHGTDGMERWVGLGVLAHNRAPVRTGPPAFRRRGGAAPVRHALDVRPPDP